MSKPWLALFVAVPLLVVGIGTASAQMHGSGNASGGHAHGRGAWHGGDWHRGQFHDGRFFFHGGRFNSFRTNFRVFIGAPAFWWGRRPTFIHIRMPIAQARPGTTRRYRAALMDG